MLSYLTQPFLIQGSWYKKDSSHEDINVDLGFLKNLNSKMKV